MFYLKQFLISLIPFFRAYQQFAKTPIQSTYYEFVKYRMGIQKRYWPAHKNCTVAHHQNIFVGINSLVGRNGNYLQGAGGIEIGNYVQLAQNVGVLSSNHDLYDQRRYNNAKVVIGDYCWIGMNSVILPGVTLGVRTIVAAGSVVTKSFPDGFCVIGGTPAKILKELDKERFKPWKDAVEYYGFIPRDKFRKSHI
ncbi:MAG: acyltransferase [Weeksellaceae bacterium]|nr:acyltransferase [Bacteroidota bacterium]MCG2781605.1 acyltransferase [Weeksellaceae bacterium]